MKQQWYNFIFAYMGLFWMWMAYEAGKSSGSTADKTQDERKKSRPAPVRARWYRYSLPTPTEAISPSETVSAVDVYATAAKLIIALGGTGLILSKLTAITPAADIIGWGGASAVMMFMLAKFQTVVTRFLNQGLDQATEAAAADSVEVPLGPAINPQGPCLPRAVEQGMRFHAGQGS